MVGFGVIKVKGKTPSERFASLQEEVERLCKEFDVEKGAVEVPPPFSYKRSTDEDGKALNISAILKNSNAAAVILASFGRLGIRAVPVDAHLWKKCHGKNLNKDDMRRLAERQFPLLRGKKISDHVCEAVCMAALQS